MKSKCIATALVMVSFSSRITTTGNSMLKKVGGITSGAGLALAGHFLCEYMSTALHEHAHATMTSVFTGKSSQVTMIRESNPLIPWVGNAKLTDYDDQSRSKQAAITAAGPLMGICSTFAQLYLLKRIENSYIEASDKEQSLSPLAYFKKLYQGSYAFTVGLLQGKKLSTVGEDPFLVGISLLRFLRYSRIIGELVYGFTPTGIPEAPGDGQKLWALLLNRGENYPVVTNRLELLIGGIMIAPIFLGCCKGLYQGTR